MNMKKPEMKIMRFVNEDVIATSGETPPALELMGCFDGKSNNLRTFVDGIEYNGGSALKAALDNKYGGNDGGNGYNSLRLYNYDGESLTFNPLPILRFNQGDSTYDNNYTTGMDKVNGKYTYSGIDGDIIKFTKSTQ